jgi:hypothetical protein
MSETFATGVRSQVSAAEWQLRCELAAAHRLVAHFVFVDLTYNHISVRAPEEAAHFLVKPANVFMEQVTASNLVKYDIDGRQVLASPFQAAPSAYNIHGAILRERPDLNAVVHTHSPATIAVSAQKQGLLMLSQQAMRFHERIAYYPYGGDDASQEGAARVSRAPWATAGSCCSTITAHSCAGRRCRTLIYTTIFSSLRAARRSARSPAALNSSRRRARCVKTVRACSVISDSTTQQAATG